MRLKVFYPILLFIIIKLHYTSSLCMMKTSICKSSVLSHFNRLNDQTHANLGNILKSNHIKRNTTSMSTRDCYRIDNNIRLVIPYVYEFTTHAKGRWIGKELLEVLCSEFGAHPKEYWNNAISYGFVKINDNLVSINYKFKNNDRFTHVTHRHEPPIYGNITLVGQNDQLIAISKPSSLPCHPCGVYKHNSLMSILQAEPLIENQPELFLVNRLDRVTSGLMVLAKSKEIANEISKLIRNRETKKYYLARVRGNFAIEYPHLQQLSLEDIIKLSEDFEDDSDSPEQQGQNKRKRNENDSSKEIIETNLDNVTSQENLYKSSNVGYCYENSTQYLYLKCPVGIINHREGIHACRTDGKVSLSAFQCLGYDSKSDTSLILCRLFTGRTHQLRLHLQFLGFPIANDPCYGGELFYGEMEKRNKAEVLLQDMRAKGYQPITKIPHLELLTDNAPITDIAMPREIRSEGESDESFLVRTCRYCKVQENMELETILHCDGIWLHAYRYSNGDNWQFETPLPDFAKPFQPLPSQLSSQPTNCMASANPL